MRTNRSIVTWVTRVMVTLVLSMSIGFLGHADGTGVDLPLEGEWYERERSISFSVSAYISNNLLSIQSSTLRSDITITVIKDGATVYEQTVPAAQTANIGISVTDWEKGMYMLELRNQWGDYLYGNFIK